MHCLLCVYAGLYHIQLMSMPRVVAPGWIRLQPLTTARRALWRAGAQGAARHGLTLREYRSGPWYKMALGHEQGDFMSVDNEKQYGHGA